MTYVNLHALPPGQHLFTVYVTAEPVGTPPERICVDEIDVVAAANATSIAVVAAADLSAYPGCRVVGVDDQSACAVLWYDVDSTIVVCSAHDWMRSDLTGEYVCQWCAATTVVRPTD